MDTPLDVIGTPMMRHSISFRNTDQNRLTPLFNTSKRAGTANNSTFSSFDMKSARPTPVVSAQNSTQSSRTMSSFDIKSGKPTPTASAQNSPLSLARICRSPALNYPDAGAKSRFLSMLSFNGKVFLIFLVQ